MGNINYATTTICKHTLIQCDCGAILNTDTIRKEARREIIKEINEIEEGKKIPIRDIDGKWTGITMLKSDAKKVIKKLGKPDE